MPRFAFALPFLPHMETTWRSMAAEIPVRRSSEHRAHLLDRGIFKERWWMQTGAGSPPLTLTLWDCDDLGKAVLPTGEGLTTHERWIATEILEGVHGVNTTPYVLPECELLSGTTTQATATAGTQTMFALPVPPEGMAAVRALIARIEHGDLVEAHRRFLADASIREEWIWLQAPQRGCPPLLLVHWIGDDLDDAWQRLTYVGSDPYARVLHEALFTRLIGISPEKVAGWQIEQLLAMHVRRSDAHSQSRRRLGTRLFGALTNGEWAVVRRLLSPDVTLVAADGTRQNGRDEVLAALTSLADRTGGDLDVDDLLIGERHVIGLLRDGADAVLPVMILAPEAAITEVRVLPNQPG